MELLKQTLAEQGASSSSSAAHSNSSASVKTATPRTSSQMSLSRRCAVEEDNDDGPQAAAASSAAVTAAVLTTASQETDANPDTLAPFLGLFSRLTSQLPSFAQRSLEFEMQRQRQQSTREDVHGTNDNGGLAHTPGDPDGDRMFVPQPPLRRGTTRSADEPPVGTPPHTFLVSDRRSRESLLAAASKATGVAMRVKPQWSVSGVPQSPGPMHRRASVAHTQSSGDAPSGSSRPTTEASSAVTNRHAKGPRDLPVTAAALTEAVHAAIDRTVSRAAVDDPTHPHHRQAVAVRSMLRESAPLVQCVHTTTELALALLARVLPSHVIAAVVPPSLRTSSSDSGATVDASGPSSFGRFLDGEAAGRRDMSATTS